jgi:hypothetical protein
VIKRTKILFKKEDFIQMKQKQIMLLLVLSLILHIIYSAETIDALSVFKLPVGAKPISCGGAYNAVSDDVNSIFYNPAGLGNIEKFEFTSMIGLLSLDRSLNIIGMAMPTNFGTIGLGILNAGVGKISKHITETKEGEFNYQANSVFISYGKNLQQINIGVNLKIIFDNLDDYSRTGFASDVGIISDVRDNLSIGVKIQNIIGVIGDDVPPLVVSLAGKYAPIKPLNVLCDVNYNLESEQFKLKTGIQYNIARSLYFGCGLNDKELSFGIGIILNKFNIYYAFSTDQFNTNNLHFVSLGIKF